VDALLDDALIALLLDVALDPLDLFGRDGAHVIADVAHTNLLKQGDQGFVF
jgi:hypothetical protein